MATDVSQFVLDLLSDNWTSSNTGNKTPRFAKITSNKRMDFNLRENWILIHRPRKQQQPQGIGTTLKHETHFIDIDIRSFGEFEESNWLEIREEADRILDSKITSPGSPFNILDPDDQDQDLSDKTHKVWRAVKTIKLEEYCKSR